jgi:hypothetical protein
MAASIKNMHFSDYRSNHAANLRVIRGKHLKTGGETQRRGTLTDRLRKVGLAPMPAQGCATSTFVHESPILSGLIQA